MSPSDAARAFIESAGPLQYIPISEVSRQRAEGEAEAATVNAAIVERYVGSLDDETIEGVRCMVVTPREVDPDDDDRRILYCFGGAFIVGSPTVDLPITARLAHYARTPVIAPYYSRAPEAQCPTPTTEVLAVYGSILGRVPANRIALAGESAGGNLALATALAAHRAGIDLPAALVLMSPWCDVTPSRWSQQQPAGFDPTLDYVCHLREAAAAYAGALDARDPRVSPLYDDIPPGLPPSFITTGTRDLFVSDCEALADKLRAAGATAELRIWPELWHVFEWYQEIPESDASLTEMAAFIRRQFGMQSTGDP